MTDPEAYRELYAILNRIGPIEVLKRLELACPAGSTPATGCRDAKRSGGQEPTDFRHSAAVAGDEGRGPLGRLLDKWEMEAARLDEQERVSRSKGHVDTAMISRNFAAAYRVCGAQLADALGDPRPKSEGQSVEGGAGVTGSTAMVLPSGARMAWDEMMADLESDGASGPGNRELSEPEVE